MPSSSILLFYSQFLPDNQGRSLAEIWQQDHQWLEKTHDYIQWLFPLPEKSRFNPHAPILTAADIAAFQASADLRANLVRSLSLMLDFYGLRIQVAAMGAITITTGLGFPQRKTQWLHWGNHNHLRLTRILRSLYLLGLDNYAQALFRCLTEIYHSEPGEITKLTFSHWQAAVSTPIDSMPIQEK